MTKPAKVTGYYAKQAISKAGRLIREAQLDLIDVALASGDVETLVAALRSVMGRLQMAEELLRAALVGDYEDVGIGGDQ